MSLSTNDLEPYLTKLAKHTCNFQTHFTTHFQNKLSKALKHLFKKTNTFVKHSSKELLQWLPRQGIFFKTFSKPRTKHHFKQLKIKASLSKQVTKSPWITMDRKGANTFPFYNLLPEPKKTSQRFLLCFLTFP